MRTLSFSMLNVACAAIALALCPFAGARPTKQGDLSTTDAIAHFEKRGAKLRYDDGEKLPYALDLSVVRDLSSADLAYLKPLVGLRKMYLDSRNKLARDDFAAFAPLVHLTELNVPGMKVSGAGMAHIGKLSTLTFLSLGNSDVADADLLHLKGLPKLRFLTLYNTKIAGPGLVNLAELKHLQFLTLGGLKIDDAHIAPLRSLQELKVLDLSGTAVSDRSIDLFQQLKSLERVDLDRTHVSDAERRRIQTILRERNK